MNPQTVSAISALLSEALLAGVSLAAIFKEVKENDRVDPATWARIESEVDDAVAGWRNA